MWIRRPAPLPGRGKRSATASQSVWRRQDKPRHGHQDHQQRARLGEATFEAVRLREATVLPPCPRQLPRATRCWSGRASRKSRGAKTLGSCLTDAPLPAQPAGGVRVLRARGVFELTRAADVQPRRAHETDPCGASASLAGSRTPRRGRAAAAAADKQNQPEENKRARRPRARSLNDARTVLRPTPRHDAYLEVAWWVGGRSFAVSIVEDSSSASRKGMYIRNLVFVDID